MKRSAFCRSAYNELVVTGSRWTRLLGKSAAEVGPPHARASVAVPYITLIPTLHVGSIKFYDRVLEYMQSAIARNRDVVILLEGICDNTEAAEQQLQEYKAIMESESLRETMVAKADENTLYSPEVMRELCAELSLDYDTLEKLQDTVRLQECYLKPKMAATCGLHLRNDADIYMKDVQQLLAEESVRLRAEGKKMPSSVAVSDLGTFPVIRMLRERKVARMARLICEKWFEDEIEGEVIVPWGYFHTEAIIHHVLEGNSKKAGAEVQEGEEAPKSDRNSLLFVESDELVEKVPFGIPKELFEPTKKNGEEKIKPDDNNSESMG